MYKILILFILVILNACNKNTPTVIRVNPTVNSDVKVSNNNVVSLSAAKEYVRELNNKEALPKGGVIIELEEGIYTINQTLNFSTIDGGKEGKPIVYRAKKGATPIISSGIKISNWTPQDDNIWKTTIPEVASGEFYFRQLFANDNRLIRARTPNQGWYRILGQTEKYDTLGKWQLKLAQDVKPKDPKIMCGAKFDLDKLPVAEDMHQAELLILSSWSAAWTTIQEINIKNGDVLFNTPLDWPSNIFSEPNPYRIENVRSALDQEGEWYLNKKTGELLLYLSEEDNPNDWNVYAPALEKVMEISGEYDRPVQNLSFEGIHFKYSKVKMGVYEYTVHEKRLTDKVDNLLWDWPSDIKQYYADWPDADEFLPGYVDLQGAVYAGAAVELHDTKNITFNNCTFSHLGAHGIYVRDRSFDTHITNSRLYNLGGGGIYQGYITDEYLLHGLRKEDVPANSLIRGNQIYQGTRFHVGAVGIFLSQTYNNKILNNEIFDMGYSGISMGWTWGHEPTLIFNNLIARNHIHHVVQQMADGGGIYTLGTLTACVIEENHIHHILRNDDASGAHVKGLYFDMGSQGAIVRRNVLHDIDDNYISYHKGTPATSFVFEENYLEDSALSHNGDYNYYKIDFPGNEIYTKPGDPNFPDDIVNKAGIQN